MQQLTQITEEFLDKAKNIDGLINFDSNLKAGKPELTLIPDRNKLAATGFTVYDLALALRASIEGTTTSTYRDNNEEYDIVISLEDESVDTPAEVENIPVVGQQGVYRMSQLADVKFTEGATTIIHRNKLKAAQFTGGVATGYVLGDIVNELTALQKEMDLPEGFQFNWGGASQMMQDTVAAMIRAFFIAMLLTYMLLAAILESFTKPFLILMTVPLSLIGVIISLYLSGINLGIIVLMGIIMLLGMVVNAAILIMDYTEQLREGGKTTKEALLEAGSTKLKPILMSSIAIIMGMLPMALGIGSAGAEMRQPLGIVSIGGVLVATLLTLFVIPALYYLTNKKHIKHVEKV
jgi:HAE1 family hydrophobic/amphiphilic exporter-1